MFDFVRKHTKIMMGVMFLLIIPSFVLFGIDGYNQFRDKGETVARVAGHDISQSEWDNAHKSEIDRVRSQSPTVDPKLLDTPQARYSTLERLVRERVVAEAAAQSRLVTGDAKLARELQQIPGIAALRRPDGTLDMDQYRQLAATQGLTPDGFEARVRSDLSARQVESGLVATSLSASAVADVALNAFFEKREVQVARFNSTDFAARVTPTDAEIEAYYEANKAQFQAPEQASIEYVVLDLDAVRKTIAINEADLKSYYDQNAARLSGIEERRASHILLSAPKAAPAADRDKARARAQALLAELRKAPDSFAELARKNSEDPGSAPNGGDLDFFARGAMDKAFESAVFAMKKGDISDVVESDFGYHIIKLTDLKAPAIKSFEELRPSIESDLKTQQARAKYAELAEAFTNGVYEQSDSLKPVADKLKLEIRTAAQVLRKPATGSNAVLANAKFLAAIFGADAIEKKHNTEAIEIAQNQLAAGRITQYAPARTEPLAEVRKLVRERLIATRSMELAKKEGGEKLAAWKGGAAAAELAAVMVVSRIQPQALPGPVLEALLRVDTAVLPAWVGVDLASQGYAVVKINKILPREAPAEAAAQRDRSQYAQWWGAAEAQAYYAVLKDRFKAQIRVARPARLPVDAAAGVAQ